MTNTPMLVQTRPFAIEPVTGVMLPDGIFDNALYKLRIACHFTNTGGNDLSDVNLYLESIGDPGIVVTSKTFTFASIPAGASVMVSWAADFQHAKPGKPLVSFVARAAGHTSTRSIRRIFVSQTRYDATNKVYTCTLPEGRLDISKVSAIPPAKGDWWPPNPDPEKPTWVGPHLPTGLTMSWTPQPAYAGVHGELPFEDPWWKVAAWIVVAIAAIVGIIADKLGYGTFNPFIKVEFEETGPDVTCCKPTGGNGNAKTVAGVASIIFSSFLPAALADDADPMWRGQEKTPPANGELTVAEQVVARWVPQEAPRVGTPYRATVGWAYERTTTGSSYHYEVAEEEQSNIHLTDYVDVTTPGTVNADGGSLWASAKFVRPDSTVFSGPDLYSFAIFQAPQGFCIEVPLSDDGIAYDTKTNDGWFTGGLTVGQATEILKQVGESPIGVWKVFVFGQDVNRVAPGTPPHIAAQTIGGFVVGSAIDVTFDPNLPCPLTAQGTIKVT